MTKKSSVSRVRRKRSLRIAQLHWDFPPVIGITIPPEVLYQATKVIK